MTTYTLIAVIAFFILGIIWSKKDFVNFLIKLFFFGMAFAGAFLWATEMGYIIKS